ncbi:hypothetical protein TNCV_1864191 [Trichonephila clavipes]|nr:hypothetical protein TNCV_1864191 [Trichonephila clavipes]
MGAEFLFMDDNARPHRANIVDECLQSEDIATHHQVVLQHIDFCTVQSIAKLPTLLPTFRYVSIESPL